ncbi:MAG: nucleotide exchange factor GrpE [Phyllobacteriaceae bacterium]|jgi:molecular chaperone GrpE|nr:nucleotide exchange factor GrpE [Phyllobacteriaceae bacterium]
MSDTPVQASADLEAAADELLAKSEADTLLEPEPDPRDGEIAALQNEVAAAKDRLLRFAAEAENQKKRLEREKAEATLYAASNFARDLLSVADSLSRALAAVPADERAAVDKTIKTFLDGIELTERELLSVFQRHNIRKLETVGAKFDPNYHQAMFEMPTAEKPPGTVMQEVQSGYAVGERCLRPALVGVAKAPD